MVTDGVDKVDRAQLLASLNGRLVAYNRDGDGRGVQDPEAVREARALLDVVRNSPADGAVQVTVAHLHWARFTLARRADPSADGDRGPRWRISARCTTTTQR